MMASSAVFGAYLIFVILLFTALGLQWLPRFVPAVVGDYIVPTCFNMGLSIIVKSFILDKFIGRKLLVKNGFVVRWAWFAWYIIVTIPLTICAGFALALTRFGMLLVIALVYVVRVDMTIFPPFLQDFDAGYTSFMAAVNLMHRHQNPVWQALVRNLVQEHGNGSVDESAIRRKASARNKWCLAVTLMNNPQLVQERRHIERDADVVQNMPGRIVDESELVIRKQKPSDATNIDSDMPDNSAMDEPMDIKSLPGEVS